MRRTQITEAAAAVIARDGVAGATTRRIAAEAELSLATLHYAFKAKDDILAAVLESLIDHASQDNSTIAAHLVTPSGAGPPALSEVTHHLVRTAWDLVCGDLVTRPWSANSPSMRRAPPRRPIWVALCATTTSPPSRPPIERMPVGAKEQSAPSHAELGGAHRCLLYSGYRARGARQRDIATVLGHLTPESQLVDCPRRRLAWSEHFTLDETVDRMSRMAAKDRREELIAAAFRVMVRDGVVKTTTRAVVNEAKMPLGVFHYCFNSREELLQEVITRITDSGVAKARNVFEGEGDLGARIARSLYAFWEGVELSPGEHQVGYELAHYALRQEGFEDLARRQYEHYLEVHEQLLAEAAESAGIKWTVPLPVLARYLNAVLDGVTLCWLADRNSENTREVLRLTGEHLVSLAAKEA